MRGTLQMFTGLCATIKGYRPDFYDFEINLRLKEVGGHRE
jgi:hypothetical protein